jgi:uncharacterized protein (TIGR02646 family)
MTDRSGQELEWLSWADSRTKLRQRLKKLEEIGYSLVAIKNYNFNHWQDEAEEAAQEAVNAFHNGEKPEFKSTVWSKLKTHLFELFHGKCAYCESRVLHVSPGDVEHYRPKKGVTEDPTHPGYYWLAYDIENLLPCCEKCNRARGKKNHFPVKGFRAHFPDDIDKEEPLLLHPYKHNPNEHLKFIPGRDGLYLGIANGITDIGKTSVEIYNLNRAELVEERRREQENAARDIGYYAFSNRAKFKEIVKEIRSGIRQYSAATLLQLKLMAEQFKADLEDMEDKG